MIPDGLDKSISTAITISSAALAFWGFRHEMTKERQRILTEAKEQFAQAELKRYAAERDFGHIQRDLDQLKINTGHISQETDERLDRLERQFEKNAGSIEILISLLKDRQE